MENNSISENRLKILYEDYKNSKTQYVSVIITGLTIMYAFSSILQFYSTDVSFFKMVARCIVAAGLFYLIGLWIKSSIVTKRCLSYEDWAKDYIIRQGLINTHNHTSIVQPFETTAKTIELQNQIEVNQIINKNMPLIEYLLQQKMIINSQLHTLELEIKKAQLNTEQKNSQVYDYLISQKNLKSRELFDLQNQINNLS